MAITYTDGVVIGVKVINVFQTQRIHALIVAVDLSICRTTSNRTNDGDDTEQNSDSATNQDDLRRCPQPHFVFVVIVVALLQIIKNKRYVEYFALIVDGCADCAL